MLIDNDTFSPEGNLWLKYFLGGCALTLPSRGMESEVGGIFSARRRKNTVSESKMLMDKDTFSP